MAIQSSILVPQFCNSGVPVTVQLVNKETHGSVQIGDNYYVVSLTEGKHNALLNNDESLREVAHDVPPTDYRVKDNKGVVIAHLQASSSKTSPPIQEYVE